jgi:hypothetical protein
MKKRVHYTDEPMQMRLIKDFLPSPQQLATRGKRVKVSVEISKSSLDFFRQQAGRSKMQAKNMIGTLLDVYATQYGHSQP